MWSSSLAAVALAAALEASPAQNTHGYDYLVGDKFVEPVTTVSGTAQTGYTTYRLSLRAKEGADVGTIYTIFGDGDTQMVIPAAFQADAPFGADIGGVSPEFFPYSSAAASDSWLSVGINGGNTRGDIASIGIKFDKWTESKPLVVDDGAVFWMDPRNAPRTSTTAAVQIGQVTTPTGVIWNAVVNAQGKSMREEAGKDWDHHGLVFTNDVYSPPPPPPPRNIRPPARSQKAPDCDSDMLAATFDAIPASCCKDERECADGFPTTCSKECGQLILPFWDSCEAYMGSIPGYTLMDEMWQNFVGQCGHGAPRNTFRCEYAELLPIALDCSSTAMESADFCSSSCAGQLLPLVQQCSGRQAFEEAIQLLVGRPVGKLVQHCVTEIVDGSRV